MARAPTAHDIEVLPEADRLGDFPHPRETRILLGHQAAERTLVDIFASGRMHHAWLLAGRAGIGKATLAYRLARYVLARPEERDRIGHTLDVPADSRAARQVTALSHPGLLALRRPYDTRAKRFATAIPVDEVRRLKSFLGLTAGNETWRIVIVDGADELNLNAANALLKSLEEPPRRALFVLVASEPSRLLPTIRSRCRRLDLHSLSYAPLRAATEAALAAADKEPPSADRWEQLARLSVGSVRRALHLVASDGLETQRRIANMFARLPLMDWGAVHVLADTLSTSTQEQRFEAFFDLFLEALATRVKGQTAQAPVTPSARLMPEQSGPQWAMAWEAILRDKAATAELNLDRRALILRMFARLEAVSKPRT